MFSLDNEVVDLSSAVRLQFGPRFNNQNIRKVQRFRRFALSGQSQNVEWVNSTQLGGLVCLQRP